MELDYTCPRLSEQEKKDHYACARKESWKCVFLDRQIMVTAQTQMRMEMAPLLKEDPGTDSQIRSKDTGEIKGCPEHSKL
ncbi:hypothetical protein TNCV_3848441 [Trichonephila clavipes]|uniref:Uncharacterized protein n=1 Tax=Trichonephila clavipes TaxID=2585209 RepID=A0A8X6V208_TRICX|nr:hypothetical protein TNCV_3848441 [Trichonephila clavipes]